MKLLTTALLLLSLCAPAIAAEPGTVKGTFDINGRPIELKYAYAHLHDNAEGLLHRPRELRILLTDREVPAETLHGISFLPVEDLAMQGKVKGLLLELDPAKPNEMVAVLLEQPAEAGRGLVRTTHSVTGSKLFKQWSFTPAQVSGEIERSSKADPDLLELPAPSFAVTFTAPVAKEPAVTADLKGKAALASPQVKVMAAAGAVLATGDIAGSRKFSTERANRQLDEVLKLNGAEFKKLAKQSGVEMKRNAARVQRVVVRGDRAVILVSKNEWITLAREGGQWKLDP